MIKKPEIGDNKTKSMKKVYLSVLSFVACGLLNAQTTTRLPLVEGLSSNTCGPCASFNSTYGPIIENNTPNEEINPGIAIVKYQMNWPSPGTDPSYNDDGNTRRGFYGTTGIPDWYIDGVSNNGTQAEIDAEKTNDAPLKITAAYTLTGNQIDVTVQIIPLQYLGNGNRCYIALTNKSYNYTGGTNGENSFHHVLRKMLPDGAGTFLSTLNANDTITITESYTYNVAGSTPTQGSYDLWNSTFEIVAWVQRTTGAKPVQNATVAAQGALGIAEGDTDDFGLIVYPNPVNDQSTVMFDAAPNTTSKITVINQLGEIVFDESYGQLNGRQRISVNTSAFAPGLYYVTVLSGDKIAREPLIIQH